MNDIFFEETVKPFLETAVHQPLSGVTLTVALWGGMGLMVLLVRVIQNKWFPLEKQTPHEPAVVEPKTQLIREGNFGPFQFLSNAVIAIANGPTVGIRLESDIDAERGGYRLWKKEGDPRCRVSGPDGLTFVLEFEPAKKLWAVTLPTPEPELQPA